MRDVPFCRTISGAAAGLRRVLAAVLCALVLGAPGMGEAQTAFPFIGLGQPLEAADIERHAITIFPDGRNLPAGQGSVEQGARLYGQHCVACHGVRGIEGPAARLAGTDGFIAWNDPLRPLRVRRHPLLVLSVGAMWPHATTLFDYVRRAMPMHAPKTLGDDEVYALTAHLLHLNRLVPADAVMSRETLPQVVMPGLARTFNAWPTDR